MYLLRENYEINPICCLDNFLTESEIETIINHAQKIKPQQGKVITTNIKEKNDFTSEYEGEYKNGEILPKIRNSLIRGIESNEKISWLYQKIVQEIYRVNQENFDYILKFIECLQFLEYNENDEGFYAKHNDCNNTDNFATIRKLSFSIQLSDPDDYEGGELILYTNEQEFIAPKTKGTIIFFQSDIVHEVTPVTKGTRYSIVGWVRGPNLR